MSSAVLVDTSVAVPAVLARHEAHEACARFVRDHRPGLAGHAVVETYAVLTRLPIGLRVTPEQALEVVNRSFPDQPQPSGAAVRRFLKRVVALQISGGAVYDALVALPAQQEQAILATRDERALLTYELLGVQTQLVT